MRALGKGFIVVIYFLDRRVGGIVEAPVLVWCWANLHFSVLSQEWFDRCEMLWPIRQLIPLPYPEIDRERF